MWRRSRIIDEIEEFESEMDELFKDIMSEKPMWNYNVGCLEPLIHIDEREDKIIVTVDLPCVTKEDITLDVTSTTLRIEAKMNRTVRYEHWGTIQRRCDFKGFKKEIPLPKEVVPEATNAKFNNGYLTVELLKKITRFKVKVK